MTAPTSPAPAIEAVQWFNTDTPPSLDALRGRVVVIETFQMLCPGSVSHGLPQASRIHETFSRDDVVVLGLHSVFEHHEAQSPTSLERSEERRGGKECVSTCRSGGAPFP